MTSHHEPASPFPRAATLLPDSLSPDLVHCVVLQPLFGVNLGQLLLQHRAIRLGRHNLLVTFILWRMHIVHPLRHSLRVPRFSTRTLPLGR